MPQFSPGVNSPVNDVETNYIERLKLLGNVNSEGILDDESLQ